MRSALGVSGGDGAIIAPRPRRRAHHKRERREPLAGAPVGARAGAAAVPYHRGFVADPVTPLTSTAPDTILHDVFGYSDFRGAQAEIVDHVIAGGDALVLMPTGGGKSLCYQVPAIARHRAERGVVRRSGAT